MEYKFPHLPDNADVDVNFSGMEYDWVMRTISMQSRASKFYEASFTYEGTTTCIAEYIAYESRDNVSMNKIIHTYEFPSDVLDDSFTAILRAYLENMENKSTAPVALDNIAIALFNTVLDVGAFVSEDVVVEYID